MVWLCSENRCVDAPHATAALFAATRWNTIAAIPPLIITEDELAQAYDIIDAALDLADKGVRA